MRFYAFILLIVATICLAGNGMRNEFRHAWSPQWKGAANSDCSGPLYRTGVYIDNSSGVAGVNIPIRLSSSTARDSIVNLGRGMLKFVRPVSGMTTVPATYTRDSLVTLDYWINPADGNEIWVELDSLFASSQKAIYCFFGCPVGTRSSSGANTFTLFEGFDGGNYSLYADAGCDTFGYTQYDPNRLTAIVPVGAGSFDSLGVRLGGCVYYDALETDASKKYKAAYGYWRSTKGSTDSVGMAWSTSPDGITWTKQGRILDTYVNHYEYHPNLVRFNDTLRCYYESIIGGSLQIGQYVWTGSAWVNRGLTLAKSSSGKTWMRDEVYHPECYTSTNRDTLFMYFSANGDSSDCVGLAYSTNGNSFTIYGSTPVLWRGAAGEFDQYGIEAGACIFYNGYYWMPYHTNNVGGSTTAVTGRARSASRYGPFTKTSGGAGVTGLQDPYIVWYLDEYGTPHSMASLLNGSNLEWWQTKFVGVDALMDSTVDATTSIALRGNGSWGQHAYTAANYGYLELLSTAWGRGASTLYNSVTATVQPGLADSFEVRVRAMASTYGSAVNWTMSEGNATLSLGASGQWDFPVRRQGYAFMANSAGIVCRYSVSGTQTVLATGKTGVYERAGTWNTWGMRHTKDSLVWTRNDTTIWADTAKQFQNIRKYISFAQGKSADLTGGKTYLDYMLVRKVRDGGDPTVQVGGYNPTTAVRDCVLVDADANLRYSATNDSTLNWGARLGCEVGYYGAGLTRDLVAHFPHATITDSNKVISAIVYYYVESSSGAGPAVAFGTTTFDFKEGTKSGLTETGSCSWDSTGYGTGADGSTIAWPGTYWKASSPIHGASNFGTTVTSFTGAAFNAFTATQQYKLIVAGAARNIYIQNKSATATSYVNFGGDEWTFPAYMIRRYYP